MKYLQLRERLGKTAYIDTPENVLDFLKESEAGEVYIIEVVEMREDDYEDLPEFKGF